MKNTSIKKKIIELLDRLNHGLVERERALKAALLAVLAGENLLLVGPPGTAKSLIARRVAESIVCDDETGGTHRYFEYLLTKFSTPEEIFGPLSISELKADRFRRNTSGYLPSVQLAFLDEVFKASSSILNALLTILNERIYHNGAQAQRVPLLALIAASNELPTRQEELDALYDRFLVRSFVDYVSDENLPRLLDNPGEMPALHGLDTADLKAVQQAAQAVTLPPDIVSAVQHIWVEHRRHFKEDRRENLSDRRLRKAVGLLRVSAATNDRSEVDLSDLLVLADCLWNHPDNALKVREMVMNTLRNFNRPIPPDMQPPQPESLDIPDRLPAPKGTPEIAIKGYKGSGTEHDPILIETLHDLGGLERPEIGRKGYWFQQTADIDCSDLDTWLDIQFTGHYDGLGHTIRHKDSTKFLLKKAWECSLKDILLQNLGLASKTSESQISTCSSNTALISIAERCQISSCHAGGNLIATSANDCKITQCATAGHIATEASKCTISQCMSGDTLVSSHITASTIQDCQIQINSKWDLTNRNLYNGGVSAELKKGTTIERCFVAGTINAKGFFISTIDLAGITYSCTSSTIRQCAIGSIKLKGDVNDRRGRRITTSIKTKSTVENNVALDCRPGESDPNGPDGKSISAALFSQHLLEHSLGWDFISIWQWNDTQRQPELRSVGLEAMSHTQRHTAPVEARGDILSEQLRSNIWL